MKTISTYGRVENFVKSALMGLGATQEDPNGRFYLDGDMVNVELSQAIAETVYIGEIFRDGQSVTGKYTTDRKAGAIRVMLDSALPSTSRTVGYGGRTGTPGNSGVINTNPPLMPANDEFMVYLDQVNDQSMLFPDLGKEYIPLDVMAQKIAAYAKSVTQDRSASTLAEILAYNIFRALNGGNNLVDSGDLAEDNAYADLVNDLNSYMDNGDPAQGAFTYATQGRTIIGRPSFINHAMSRKSGLIMLGGDLAQEMLKNYDLDRTMSDRDYVGTGYKGFTMGFHWQSAPDYIWTLAEQYLNLPKGALDNVQAIAVSYEATAMGRVVDLGVKLIDANEVRGIKGQPLNIWGHEAFRKSFIVGDSTLTLDYLKTTLGFSEDKRVYPVHPNEVKGNKLDTIDVPIFGADGAVIGYKRIASVPTPNGDNMQSGLPHVAEVTATPAAQEFSSATLEVTLATPTSGAEIYYTTDGTTPTTESTKYTAALSLTQTTNVKAIAVKKGSVPSSVMVAEYTKVAAPTKAAKQSVSTASGDEKIE